MADHDLNLLEISGNYRKWLEWPEIAVYGCKLLEWMKMAVNGCNLQYIAVHCCKWMDLM